MIGVGTWQFGGEWGVSFTAREVDSILGTAQDNGINLIDTAECYGDHLAEHLVADRLQRERDKWFVASKFGHHFHSHMDRTRHFDPEDVRGQVHSSLRALKTDYLDILQFHSPTDEEFLNEELWSTLDELKQEGLIRSIGLSVSKNDNTMQVRRAPEAGCEVLQVVYNRIDRAPESEVLPAAAAADMGVLARVPLASGFLSGKYSVDSVFPGNDWRSRIDPVKRAEMLDEIARVERDELPEEAPLVQWALVWPLANPAVTAVIPGAKDANQMRANAEAIRWLAESTAD